MSGRSWVQILPRRRSVVTWYLSLSRRPSVLTRYLSLSRRPILTRCLSLSRRPSILTRYLGDLYSPDISPYLGDRLFSPDIFPYLGDFLFSPDISETYSHPIFLLISETLNSHLRSLFVLSNSLCSNDPAIYDKLYTDPLKSSVNEP